MKEMISQEFKKAVEERDLLRVRIMLKDSLIIDPSFGKFEKMLRCANAEFRDIYVNYDGGQLERNPEKWNQQTLNHELVELVDNFSKERIDHLKKVIDKLLSTNMRKERNSNAVKKTIEGEQKKKRSKSFNNCGDAKVTATKQIKDDAEKITRLLETTKVKDTNFDEIKKLATDISELVKKVLLK